MSCELFYREGCHLCEDMINQLRELFPRLDFQLLNVDSRQQWFDEYNEKVPLLKCGDQILCQYFLEPEKIRKYFNGQSETV
jgi:hypothetical protein